MCNDNTSFDMKKKLYVDFIEKHDKVFSTLSSEVFNLLKHPEAKIGYANFQWYLNGVKCRIDTAIFDLTKDKPTEAIIDEWTFNKDTSRL